MGPLDLAELVVPRSGRQHLDVLAAALHADRWIYDRGTPWQTACDALGTAARLNLGTSAAVASALQVAAVLSIAPLLKVSAVESVIAQPAHPKLAKVRALLAKAESTPFDEEAEALSAKAREELISRHALGRFLDGGQSAAADGCGRRSEGCGSTRRTFGPRRRWSMRIVDQPVSGSRLRQDFGFSVVVGAAADLDAVELLVTSLLVQADTAMLRYARRSRGDGGRTRAFRQSFLLAYANRIGRRLRAAADQAVSASERDRRAGQP